MDGVLVLEMCVRWSRDGWGWDVSWSNGSESVCGVVSESGEWGYGGWEGVDVFLYGCVCDCDGEWGREMCVGCVGKRVSSVRARRGDARRRGYDWRTRAWIDCKCLWCWYLVGRVEGWIIWCGWWWNWCWCWWW